MKLLTTDMEKAAIADQYDIVSDAKNRINLRNAKSKYFHVKVLSNGCYFLEPRILVAPLSISAPTLKTIDRSVAYLKRKKKKLTTKDHKTAKAAAQKERKRKK